VAQFAFSGRNAQGQLINGQMEASTADGVVLQLTSQGVIPLKIDVVDKEQSLIEKLNGLMPAEKVDTETLIMFSRQMFSLVRSGVVLTKAIRGLADSSRNARMKQVLMEIETSLNMGNTLSTSMRKHPDVFDALYVNIIQVGESSGRLEMVFQQLAFYLGFDRDTKRQIKTAMRYPTFVLIAISAAMVILNIFVIPKFADMFSKFGADLPLPTKILIATSNTFVNYWQVMLIAIVAVIVGVTRYLQTVNGRLLWDQKKLRIPVIGTIIERAMLARFSRSFSMMLKSGVPLIQGLEQCAVAVGNTFLSLKIREIRRGIERGETLTRTATQSQMFTPLVLQMISVGEDTGRIDELLQEVAEFYEQEVEYDVKNLSSAIEPILIVFMAGLVGMLAMGIFLPMWDMMKVVQGG
jgi:MSHA biogenesis protein MshG